MKITSKALFFEDADRSNGMVVFTGTGAVHGTDTDIQKIIDLPESSLCFKSNDSDGNVVVIVRTPAGDFPLTLSDVENQETWVNTQAGADAALAMIDSWKKKSSVEINLPDPSTAEVGQVVGAVDGAYAFVNPPAPTNPKVYRALLSQFTRTYISGVLEVGKEYLISTLESGDDFTNIGYVEAGTPFIATGTTPTGWKNGTSVMNLTDSKPIATVLENSLEGTPSFTYSYTGHFECIATGLLTPSKTMIFLTNMGNGNVWSSFMYNIIDIGEDGFTLYTLAEGGNGVYIAADGCFDNTSIEILVYD